jgi:hypothetical protein
MFHRSLLYVFVIVSHAWSENFTQATKTKQARRLTRLQVIPSNCETRQANQSIGKEYKIS